MATVVGVRQTSDLVKQFDRMWDIRQNLLVFAAGLLVLMLLTFFVKFTYLFAYLFGFLLASLAAVTMIFAARVLHEKTPEIQEPRIITFLADIQLCGLSLPLAFLYYLFSLDEVICLLLF